MVFLENIIKKLTDTKIMVNINPTHQKIADYIIANPNKFSYSELGRYFDGQRSRVYWVAFKYGIRDLVLKHQYKPKLEKKVHNPNFFLKRGDNYEQKELGIVNSIRKGENMFSIQKRLSISFHTVKKIMKKHGLESYHKTSLELRVTKIFLDLVKCNPNQLTEKDIAKQMDINVSKVKQLAVKHNVLGLINNYKDETLKKQLALLNQIQYSSRQDLVHKAVIHNIPDRLIADRLGVTKQRVNQIRWQNQKSQDEINLNF